MNDDGIRALAQRTAHHLEDVERVLVRVETKVDGHTDQLAILKLHKFAWPPVVVALLAIVGGFAGELLFRLVFAK